MDLKLVKQSIDGDKESFTTLILQYKDEAYRLAFCFLYQPEDSMDAVCNAVEQAFRHIRALRQPQYFKTWFLRIVMNESKRILRKRKSERLFDAVNYTNLLVNQTFDIHDLDVITTLNHLKPKVRRLIYMRFYLDLTYEEIAKVTKLPIGTVKTTISRGLKSMRTKLEVKEA